MLLASCPLRISLFGGSTDIPAFIEKYNFGSVISFTCNLKTYITIHRDTFGYNIDKGLYIINYSKKEEVKSISEIKNDPVRVVLDHFNIDPLTISLTSDSYSQGSGLASSSSYLISLIKAIAIFKNMNFSNIEICNLAHKLELKFNPFCGFQDAYGCGIGGLKKIDFEKDGTIKYNFLESKIFNFYDTHLVFTEVTRNSSTVLQDVTKNIDKAKSLIPVLEDAHKALISENYRYFVELINYSWEEKKKTSKLITGNTKVIELDNYFIKNKSVLAHKLCGAGNGGFFLLISEKGKLNINMPSVKINLEPLGVSGKKF
ncbi:MAG: hypothetical protein CMB29_05720 [Euryarchaeota archaeon]|nr:hypothetical protein [Euryarchaeota archaeon]|tara:strand:- start:24336 stop:25283 length:948 start_codon:yes stop_codon:yes gene_type:complete